jgi:hypothetical protein
MIYITKWWRHAGIIALADDLVEENRSAGILWLADGEAVVLPSGYRLEQRYTGNPEADGSFSGEVLPLVVEGEWFRDLVQARNDVYRRARAHLRYLEKRLVKTARQGDDYPVVEAKRQEVK